jgi:hypothetical protein
MLRRSLLGVFAFSALSLATVASVGASSETTPAAIVAPTEATVQAIGPRGCTDCQIVVDPCEFLRQCEPMPMLWPENLGLHPTVIHANLFNYYPNGPLTCMRSRLAGPAVCGSTDMGYGRSGPAEPGGMGTPLPGTGAGGTQGPQGPRTTPGTPGGVGGSE